MAGELLDSKVPTYVTALYDAVLAAPGILDAAPPARVWDGPVATGDPADAVWIGYDGNPDGEFQAVVGDEDWAGLGARAKDEQFDIVCSVTVLAGGGTIAAARTRAYALFAAAARAVRENVSLGQPPPSAATVRGPQLFVEPTSQGLQVRLVFRVNVRTRI